jgi:conjugative relaxase-like TrwC/TraI family protein
VQQVAVVVGISKGVDLDYYWGQAGGANATGAEYYLQAAAHGEPAGRWSGKAAAALGLHGQLAERTAYDLLFGERKAPDGTPLGRRVPSNTRQIADIYEQFLAAEPHATAERKLELRIAAAQAARHPPLYFDVTVSLSKSISVFHASLGENARLAKEAGDLGRYGYWADLVAEVDEMIYAANAAGMAYFEREAGYTRTGSHAARVDGRETGQWRKADLAFVSWFQHTSRDGDPQLHVHNQVAHVARTHDDGKWRAPDSYGYGEHGGAVAEIVAAHLESALTRRFGLGWVPRKDGYGFEIKGIAEPILREFSSRRVSIDAQTRARAKQFEQENGRKPSQHDLTLIKQHVAYATRKGKEGTLDFNELHANWAGRLARKFGETLAGIAPGVWGLGGSGVAAAEPDPGPSPDAQHRAAQMGLAAVQQAKASWTRADLIKHIGQVLPRTGMDAAASVEMLEHLADRALGSEFGQVVCLEAPEVVAVPAALRRADGRSVYQRHGGTRYATQVQLSLEEKLVAQAQAEGAPKLSREQAAQLLGAPMTLLEAALHGRAADALGTKTGCGLRLDQAAALYASQTSGRRVDVIVGPGGTGKTTTAGTGSKLWYAAGMGNVFGIATSQAATNSLHGAGVANAANAATHLGHLPEGRGARGARPIGSMALIVADEGSMMATPDVADLVAQAERGDGKLLLLGDHQQLEAVESGGAMSLLIHKLGYTQLAEPVRFKAQWERDASLRFRAGDASVLADYDTHGRIRGAAPEQLLDQAAKDYVALTLAGKDALLMVRDHERRRELSRRIRDDLVHLGLVDAGRSVPIADGLEQASVGDLIVCRKNNRALDLANGDILRVEHIGKHGIAVRKALDADYETGTRRWDDDVITYGDFSSAELAYAVTGHAAQSRTVHTGMAVITGTEHRNWAYVGMSRGTTNNVAYVCTTSPKTATPQPGVRPAFELARADRIEQERAGLEVSAGSEPKQREAVAVLADVIERDGSELSASELREHNLAQADHLSILNAMWQGETVGARQEAYRQLVLEALPPEYQQELKPTAKWLYRTMQMADSAGLDVGELVQGAVSAAPLTGARDIAAVLDARMRDRVYGLVPLASKPWGGQVPEVGDSATQTFLTDLAAAMDERQQRLGEHAADSAATWAVDAIGPVPEHPVDRLDWQQRASAIGAYRELYGYDNPRDAIGPEPTADLPEKRAQWHAAFQALRPVDGPDVRGLPDGRLHLMRRSYEAATVWAPRYTAEQLRSARLAAEQASLAAVRAEAEATLARAAGDTVVAERHEQLANASRQAEHQLRASEAVLATTMEDRDEWSRATEVERYLAVAADAELRRRHPENRLEPLVSAEPEPLETDEPMADELPAWATTLEAEHLSFADRLAERQTQRVPDEDPDYADLGPAYPAWQPVERDAILQPPKPQITPSPRVTERAIELEAAG